MLIQLQQKERKLKGSIEPQSRVEPRQEGTDEDDISGQVGPWGFRIRLARRWRWYLAMVGAGALFFMGVNKLIPLLSLVRQLLNYGGPPVAP